jgi:hypothetical protein
MGKRTAQMDKIRKDAVERMVSKAHHDVKLSPELWDAVEKVAKEKGKSVDTVVSAWIKERLKEGCCGE